MEGETADEPASLEELAGEFGVSRERIRQIEVRAFEKVQKATRSAIAATEIRGAIPLESFERPNGLF